MNNPTKYPNLIRHFFLGLAGSTIVLAFLFYAASDPGQNVKPDVIYKAIKNSSLGLFLVYILLALIGIVIRAVRYRMLIQAAGEANGTTPDLKTMCAITAVRGMVVDLLPARLGELIYVGLVKKFAGTSAYRGISSLLFALVLDVAVLAPITLILVLAIGFPNSAPLKVAIIATVIVSAIYFSARYMLPWMMKKIEQLPVSEGSFVGKIANLIKNLSDAVQATLEAGILGRVLILTVGVRTLKYMGLLILFHSVSAASYPSLVELGSFGTLAAMISSEMTAALPIPTLMSFGAWEVGGMTFMALLGAAPTESLVALIATHILTQSVDYGIGILALFILFFGVKDIRQRHNQARKGRGFTKAGIFALASSLLLVISYVAFQSNHKANAQNEKDSTFEGVQLPTWLNELSGHIVWSSNRSGNHDIMMMTFPDMTIRPLTDNAHTETHPKLSKNGKKVVFTRSHRVWQSWRFQRPWNIWIKDIKSGEEKKIVDNGNSPSWSPDQTKIYFYRHLGEIWFYDLESGNEEKLSSKALSKFEGVELFWPTINQDGQISLSYRDAGQPKNILSDKQGNIIIVARGCMITWSPSGKFAFFVSNISGGKQTNQFNRYDPQTGEITKWFDSPGTHSHEYFPKLDASENYLTYAASSGGHEPDIEDYEIFLWNVNTPESETFRLTFDNGNDSWPDIYIEDKN